MRGVRRGTAWSGHADNSAVPRQPADRASQVDAGVLAHGAGTAASASGSGRTPSSARGRRRRWSASASPCKRGRPPGSWQPAMNGPSPSCRLDLGCPRYGARCTSASRAARFCSGSEMRSVGVSVCRSSSTAHISDSWRAASEVVRQVQPVLAADVTDRVGVRERRLAGDLGTGMAPKGVEAFIAASRCPGRARPRSRRPRGTARCGTPRRGCGEVEVDQAGLAHPVLLWVRSGTEVTPARRAACGGAEALSLAGPPAQHPPARSLAVTSPQDPRPSCSRHRPHRPRRCSASSAAARPCRSSRSSSQRSEVFGRLQRIGQEAARLVAPQHRVSPPARQQLGVRALLDDASRRRARSAGPSARSSTAGARWRSPSCLPSGRAAAPGSRARPRCPAPTWPRRGSGSAHP